MYARFFSYFEIDGFTSKIIILLDCQKFRVYYYQYSLTDINIVLRRRQDQSEHWG